MDFFLLISWTVVLSKGSRNAAVAVVKVFRERPHAMLFWESIIPSFMVAAGNAVEDTLSDLDNLWRPLEV